MKTVKDLIEVTGKTEAGKRGVRRGYDQVKSDFYCDFESLGV